MIFLHDYDDYSVRYIVNLSQIECCTELERYGQDVSGGTWVKMISGERFDVAESMDQIMDLWGTVG